MTKRPTAMLRIVRPIAVGALLVLIAAHTPAFGQTTATHDPAEPQQKAAKPKLLPRPAGAVARSTVDEKSMRALIEELVACGTRLSIASWSDPNHGPGCGRLTRAHHRESRQPAQPLMARWLHGLCGANEDELVG